MANVRIEVDYNAVGRLLKSDDVANALSKITSDIAARVGDEYQTDTKVMGTRVIASVYTEDKAALQDNLDNNTLLKGAFG